MGETAVDDNAALDTASTSVRCVAAHAPCGGRLRGIAGLNTGRLAGWSQSTSGRCRSLRMPQSPFAWCAPCWRCGARQLQ